MGVCSSKERDESVGTARHRKEHQGPREIRDVNGKTVLPIRHQKEKPVGGSNFYVGFDSHKPTKAERQKARAVQAARWVAEQRSPYGAVPEKGEAVAVVGLKRLPEYNGRVGIVKAIPIRNFVNSRSRLRRKPRYAVFLPGWSQLLNIRMENLCVLDRHRIPVVVSNGKAGLEFHKDDCGWLVTSLSESPGQTHLRKRDIIISVDGKSLMCRSTEEQTKLVDKHLKDGVALDILRTPSRNRSRRERPSRSGPRKNFTASSTSRQTGTSPNTQRRRGRVLTDKSKDMIERVFHKTPEGKAPQQTPEAGHYGIFIFILTILRIQRHRSSPQEQARAWAEGRAVQIATKCGIKRLPSQFSQGRNEKLPIEVNSVNEVFMNLGLFMSFFEQLDESRFSDDDIERALRYVLKAGFKLTPIPLLHPPSQKSVQYSKSGNTPSNGVRSVHVRGWQTPSQSQGHTSSLNHRTPFPTTNLWQHNRQINTKPEAVPPEEESKRPESESAGNFNRITSPGIRT